VSPYEADAIEPTKKYQILMDTTFSFNNMGGKTTKLLNYVKKFPSGKALTYDGGSAARANNYRPQLHLFSHTPLDSSSMPVIKCNMISKLSYSDA
jgi:hypothetical protein